MILTQESIETLRQRQQEVYAAEVRFNDEIERLMPPGTIVRFVKGGGQIEAEVLESGNQTRIRNLYTGKEYWIDIDWIIQE